MKNFKIILALIPVLFFVCCPINKADATAGCCWHYGSDYMACTLMDSANRYSCSTKYYEGDSNCEACYQKNSGCCIEIQGERYNCQDKAFKLNCQSTGQEFQLGKTCSAISRCGTEVSSGGGYGNSICDNKCTSTQTCEKMESGKWQCVEKSSAGDKTASSIPPTVFTNPLKYNTLKEFLNNGLSVLRSIIVVLSIIFIVIGGVMYIISAGNDDMMKKAKGAITASLIGLAIGIAAPSFLKEIYTIFGGNGSEVDTSQLAGPTLTQIAMNFLNFLLSIVGILALIMLIIGGIMYLTSAGDEDRIKSAKKIVTYSIIGIAVSLASLVIVKQIAVLLG